MSNPAAFKDYPFLHFIGDQAVIFVHIPLTGGTSLRRQLQLPKPQRERGLRKHLAVREIIELVGRPFWEEAYKFAFVRNPWDRLLSVYRRRLKRGVLNEKFFGLTFVDWGKHILARKNRTALNAISPQWEMLINEREELELNFLGRFENYAKDFQHIQPLLPNYTPGIHVGKTSTGETYHSSYDQELKEIVEAFYKVDIERFGYSYE